MGRKIKPIGLHRKAISISLPLDVIGFLDKMVLSTEGLTRSRFIESVLRNSMTKGQTTLTENLHVYRCQTCDFEGRTKKDPAKFKHRFCKVCEKDNLYYAGRYKHFQGDEEE